MKCKFYVLLSFLVLSQFNYGQKSIRVDAGTKGEKFEHFWSKCVGAGRANEALRAGWLEQMEKVQQNCGFEYVRFHGLFHEDMFPVLREKGKLVYNWQYIDDVFDRLLDMNVRPFVELAFFPNEFAAEDSKTVFWWEAKVTPGPDFASQWHDLIEAFTQHVVDRYGIDEVLTWYFEVWNEPNLYPFFFHGKKSQYFELYKQSALAVKSVDERLKIGGPATSNFVPDTRFDGEIINNEVSMEVFKVEDINTLQWHGVWIEDFLKFCEKEKLPVDFISTHPYPTDYAFNPETGKGRGLTRHVHSIIDDLEWLQKIVQNSAYSNAEIHLTEWNTSPSSRDRMHDLLPAAAYIVKSNLDCIGLTNSLAFWTFTDIFEEKGGAASIFHGGFGMINFQGLVKPSYHAYRMLHLLGDEKLYKDDAVFVSRNSGDGKIVALAYNYPKENEGSVPAGYKSYEYLSEGSSKQLKLELKHLKPGAMFQIEILDKDHGNVCHSWEKMGKPEPPTREQIKVLKNVAENLKTETVVADKDGRLTINREIAPWNVMLIQQIN
ncbi:GH39 family glycosyl hydrolase [Saccharicrinis fermentans]|uniref:Beta-xylosidase n=1 Tax=Saccharicrinis fermentans DSM 9555 = JCM 21142 TaxID=869213 RepID=W7YN27_9BACT|nr:glycoside hydrolase [Saccharicrinis fermentans]GAF03814.1 beta-xylosidase [Saccharicrinis fermentans DSM 9555 = JCM 21142]